MEAAGAVVVGSTPIVWGDRMFEILAENNVDDDSLSSPAISEGQIFIRTTGALGAVGKRK